MSWRYRVLCLPSEDSDTGEEFLVVETYYDAEGNPKGYAESPPSGRTLEGLQDDLKRMVSALEAPVLVPSDFRGRG